MASVAPLFYRTSASTLRPSILNRRNLVKSPNSLRFLNSFGPSSRVAPHTEIRHLPFDYLNKRAFTYKFISFVGLGFALPWVAVEWIWYRPGGLKNP